MRTIQNAMTGSVWLADAASLATMLANAAPGDRVVLGGMTYETSVVLTVKPGVQIEGVSKYDTIIKAADGSNLANVLQSEEFTAGNDNSDSPVRIRNLTVDGNRDNNVGGNGILLMNYWSTVDDVQVKNCDGSGLVITATESDASEIANTLVECRINRCDFRSITGDGIRIQDDSNTTQTVTDGFITDCIFQTVDGNGLRVDSAAGWLVRGNHFYGVKKSCIRMSRSFETRIFENYGETWGTGTVADSETYCFIDCSTGGVTGTLIIANNNCFHAGGIQTGRSVRGVAVQVYNGSTADVSITGNVIRGATHTTSTVGIRLTCQGATATCVAHISGVPPRGWNSAFTSAANGGSLTFASTSSWVA